MSFNRRSFIRYASLAAAGNFAGLRPFGAMNGLAQSGGGYKALVCIFLYGGNDSNNVLVPFNTSSNGSNNYSAYANARGSLALSQGSLLPLGASVNGNYGLHPSMGAIQGLFNNGNAAIVANVGTLVTPLTRSQYLNGATTPSNLFSHADQQLEWQNASQNAGTATGWAGRIADTLDGNYNSGADIPLITSVAGDTLFCNGGATSPISVNPGNVAGAQCTEWTACAGRLQTAQQMLNFDSGLSLVQADKKLTKQAYQYMNVLGDAMGSVSPLKTYFPSTSIGLQLKQIAQIIQVRAALGVNRQIFFAGLGNFDTHASQLAIQGNLLSQLSPAMSSFYQATQELNVNNAVTTFTMSDFNRALQPNSNYGSDHAWGGHHIVMGAAVNGGQLYGNFPDLTLGGDDDSDQNGRWVPSTSSAQYAATLASWFGVPSSSMSAVFPTINNFSVKNLGFV